jgi:hypothetical protein
MNKNNLEKGPSAVIKITPEKRNEYIIMAMEWSKKKVAGDEEGALFLKKELLHIEQELSMTAEQIINSNSD